MEGKPETVARVVAATAPEPVTAIDAPDPTVMVAVVLVLVVIALNAEEPPLPQVEPESVSEVELAHCAQCPEVMAPVCTGMLAPASEVAPVPPPAGVRVPERPSCTLPPEGFENENVSPLVAAEFKKSIVVIDDRLTEFTWKVAPDPAPQAAPASEISRGAVDPTWTQWPLVKEPVDPTRVPAEEGMVEPCADAKFGSPVIAEIEAGKVAFSRSIAVG